MTLGLSNHDSASYNRRMITDIVYAIETVIVLELMTHAEYSKDRWKQGY